MTDKLPPDKEDAKWQPTFETRAIPTGDYDIIPTDTGAFASPRYRTERMWIRVWAEKEWRAE